MKGLELAQRFYAACRPQLLERIPEVMACSAAGLAGEGSECFGLDDAISQDHDFGAAFCLWIPDTVFAARRDEIEQAFAGLPATFEGYASRLAPSLRVGRVGPLPEVGFCRACLGIDHAPKTWQEWMRIPEHRLAVFSNGRVFEDAGGTFTAMRKAVQDFYPGDVLLKKTAARVMQMAQAGQYNLPRSLQRQDPIAAMTAAARFSEAAISFVYLSNRRYTPFYKQAGRLLPTLPLLGRELHSLLLRLAAHPLRDERDLAIADEIETFCGLCASHLVKSGMSDLQENWLWLQGPRIARKIADPALRSCDLLLDIIP